MYKVNDKGRREEEIMNAERQILVDNLEDLAVIVWHRAIVRKQPITVRCPDPEAFVPFMLETVLPLKDITRLSMQEAVSLAERAKLVADSSLEFETGATLGYISRS